MSEDYINFIINKFNIVEKQEIRALYLYYYWIKNRIAVFPNMVHGKFSRKKDPRNTGAYKYCYKAQREFKDTLEEKHYELYVKAQLLVLRFISEKYKNNLLVEPTCLVGEKAWKRWKSFKYKYDKLKNFSTKTVEIKPNLLKVRYELISTKDFLLSKLNYISSMHQDFSAEPFVLSENNLIRWFNLRKISPYFVILNNDLNKRYEHKELSDLLKTDLLLYRQMINDKIKELYESIFKEKPFEENKK
jgi:hypothetical protein